MSITINNAYIPDFERNAFYKASIRVENNIITEISEKPFNDAEAIDADGKYLTPGLIDCHCHIESSLLPPAELGETLCKYGTLHLVADCHEITNVSGRKGLEFFMENAEHTDCNIKFAIPSCVPATPFATSGGVLTAEEIADLMPNDNVVALGEVMNIPAAVNKDKNILKMIEAAKKYNKRVNGHAPHLDKETLEKYISVGIEDDHESETYEELKYKIEHGLKVFLREGSAEKTADEAYKIINEYPDKVMFCTDDKTIKEILNEGHINYHLKKAVSLGIDPILALRVASYNGLQYYSLEKYSEIKVGNFATFVIFEDLINFNPSHIFVEGKLIDDLNVDYDIPDFIRDSFKINIQTTVPEVDEKIEDIIMKATDGSVVSKRIDRNEAGDDILKMAIFERYGHGNKSAAYVSGFNFKKGAIASSVAHDCHNIIAVGVDDESILKAVNSIIKEEGGLAVYDGENINIVPLHIGGIVSDMKAEVLAEELEKLKTAVVSIGCDFKDALSTLSFMALEVIPEIKLTDRGLFDVTKFEYF